MESKERIVDPNKFLVMAIIITLTCTFGSAFIGFIAGFLIGKKRI
jgi:hypothetical protein